MLSKELLTSNRGMCRAIISKGRRLLSWKRGWWRSTWRPDRGNGLHGAGGVGLHCDEWGPQPGQQREGWDQHWLDTGLRPDHLTCLLRNLYAVQEATARTVHGTTDWFQIRKGVCQGCILSPCLFNFYAEYIMRNTGLEDEQAGIKIARRNINNLRYADDTTLMAESE